jgi:hypothetical protein
MPSIEIIVEISTDTSYYFSKHIPHVSLSSLSEGSGTLGIVKADVNFLFQPFQYCSIGTHH